MGSYSAPECSKNSWKETVTMMNTRVMRGKGSNLLMVVKTTNLEVCLGLMGLQELMCGCLTRTLGRRNVDRLRVRHTRFINKTVELKHTSPLGVENRGRSTIFKRSKQFYSSYSFKNVSLY